MEEGGGARKWRRGHEQEQKQGVVVVWNGSMANQGKQEGGGGVCCSERLSATRSALSQPRLLAAADLGDARDGPLEPGAEEAPARERDALVERGEDAEALLGDALRAVSGEESPRQAGRRAVLLASAVQAATGGALLA